MPLTTGTRILLFLATTANEQIASVLSHAGYQPVSVSTVPEAFDALRQGDFAFAITTRPDIDLLRNIRAIPVINIEVFFHVIPATGLSQARSRKFDRSAFLERVAFLARTAVTTTDEGPPPLPTTGYCRHDCFEHPKRHHGCNRSVWQTREG
ncbi:hypothetical protein [Rhizobium paknamense]|uniref:Uncharacterized protein n=1 Tax=Rhizobium paknamense TaxID=1206817 RepID=A0ABU0IJ05_9HYPH|nr:hypothetical protein [Rhizobium paknamense]MDQ0458237.1 hypothetical protein [Rhizobium paknamense]